METNPCPYLKHLYVCLKKRQPAEAACANRGAEAILARLKEAVAQEGLKGRVRVSGAGCMDLCERGVNVMVHPDHRWYSGVARQEVERIIERELKPLAVRGKRAGEQEAIGAFLFDLGNVLFRFDHMRAAASITRGTAAAPEELFRLFFDSPLVVDHDEGRISTRDFFRVLRDEMGLNLPYEEFLRAWNDIFTEDRPMTGLARTLSERYPLYLISNTNRPHFEFLRGQSDVFDRFRCWILSYEVGHLKPHPAIYKRALDVIRLPARQVFYVDDRSDLIAAARRLGFQTHRFTGYEPLAAELKERGILGQTGQVVGAVRPGAWPSEQGCRLQGPGRVEGSEQGAGPA